jgi:proline iminopeptidase
LWHKLIESIPPQPGIELTEGLYKAVFGEDEVTKKRAAKAWINWGGQVALLDEYMEESKPGRVTKKMVQQVQMELHFAQNKYFISENQILNECKALQHIPTIIIHGRKDLVCPIEAGFSLHKALPNAEYIKLPNAGHIASGKEMINALVDATDKMLKLIQ